MPFKSEKQRRYLWANEPEIARDWADTYGSKIQAADGGIIRLPFQWGGPGGKSPETSASGGTHEGGYGRDGRDDRRGQHLSNQIKTHTTAPRTLSDPEEKRDYFEQSWTGPKGLFSGGYRNLKTPGVTAGGHKSRFNPMGILAGLISKPLGWATTGINTLRNQFNKYGTKMGDWRENLTGYRTQKEYDEARAERQLRNRINRLRKTRDVGKYSDDPEGWAASDLSSRLSGFENQLGITGIASDINYPGGEPVASLPMNWNYQGVNPSSPEFGGIMDIDTETFEQQIAKNKAKLEELGFTETTEELLPENDPFAGDAEETLLEKAKRINEEANKPLSAKLATHPATGESVHDKFPGRSLEWLSGLQDDIGSPQTFIRDYNKRNEPYPFINYHPDDEEIAIMRGYES